MHQFDKQLPGQARQLTVFHHGHSGRAYRPADQGLLAEIIASLQFLQYLLLIHRRQGHRCAPVLEYIEMLTRLAITHHRITGLDLDIVEVSQQTMQMRRRQATKQG